MNSEMSLTILKKKNSTMINFAHLTCIRSRLSVPVQVAQAHNQSPEQHYVPYLLANLLFIQ